GSTVVDLPSTAWMLLEASPSESAARARYFEMRSFLEESGAPCLVVESVKPVFGPEELRVLIKRSAALDKGRVPDAVRLSRDQAAVIDAAIEDAAQRSRKGFGPLKARPRHPAAWASVFAGFVVTMVGVTGYMLWEPAPSASTVAAAEPATDPAGSLIVLPDGNSQDRFVMFRLRRDGTRTDERRIGRAEYDAMQAQGGRTFRGKEPPGASRTSSLAEHTSMFARFRAAD
ncbi:hypothetical protein WDZ92_40055, partial [Nostoc sp. NIES-2111]